jgi:HAAS domain-containing protein
MNRHEAPRDLIGEYLDELRRGLRALPGEAEVILAEAEDHLRETAGAGIAIGMAERAAQEAAISSFGPVRAVTRAHLARAAGDAGAWVKATLAAWKLAALLLLAGGISSMAIVVLTGFAGWVTDAGPMLMAGPGPYRITYDHLTFNAVSGVWTQTIGFADLHLAYISGGNVTWLNQPFPGWHAAVVMAVTGVVLLTGYGLARRRRPADPLAGLFPSVAVSVFGALALAFVVLGVHTRTGMYSRLGPVIAVCLAITLGYAVRLGQVLLRQR